jgi:NADPH-dependent 2,4-dienoyl-CoA reductase/sulfur reductase-like enzyme/rhodanese-related sulfurtransferase
MKVCVVGGVAGGATVAARLRRLNEDAEIIVFERGDYISYANCGLPYYLGATIEDRDNLFVQTPERLKRRLNLDARVRSTVTEIDRARKVVKVVERDSGREYEESYDTLVLSPGAEPIRPPIDGIDDEAIFTLRSVPDMDRIEEHIRTQRPKRAVLVGAGFIGLEMAENLHHRGIFVTIVEMLEQVMNVLDYEMAAEVHQHLKTKKVEFYLRDGVKAFERSSEGLVVVLNSGRRLPADMVILSIGVRPESGLAKAAGLRIGERGGIVVDRNLRSEDPDIYAVGDAIEFPHPVSKEPTTIPLAWPANFQARIVADNITFGNTKTYRGTFGTAIAKVFDMTVGSTGLNEKQLDRANRPYKVVIVHSSSHAGYYPNSKPVSLKVIFDPDDGTLLGAQAVGYEGVDKRIDMVSTFLMTGGSVAELAQLEHAYAPPYSAAKDPVNIAGYIGENILAGISDHIQWYEVVEPKAAHLFLLDVRTEEENADGTIPGAMNIPVDDLRGRLSEIPKDKTIVVFCQVGQRAYFAERILRQSGFENVLNLSGGYTTYALATQDQSNEDIFGRAYIDVDDTIYGREPKQR